jgi:hypothetical protein
MKTKLFAACTLLALCAATSAWATPSTLIWIPSTDIQADKTFHLGIDTFNVPSGGSWPTDYGVTYGFAGGKAEVGVDYFGGAEHPVYFNAKYLALTETEDLPAIALGAYNFGTESDATDYNMLYVLGAKTFGKARVTLGYCNGNEDTLGADENMLLAGVDGYLTEDKKWWGAVDYQSGKNAFGALSFGVSYSFAENASVLVGYDLFNDSAIDDVITVQVDINL